MSNKIPLKVKICGLTRPEDVETAIGAGADMLGFIVEAESPRNLTIKRAARLAAPAKNIIPRIAVTVNMRDADIARLIRAMAPDYIQLHGDESPKRAAYIGRRFGVKTIKALSVSTTEHVNAASDFKGAVDLILFDAKPPKNRQRGEQRGGLGQTFDWTLLKADNKKTWKTSRPDTFILAGGLTPENAARAVKITNAPIIDISSGVERSAGVKDAMKIRRLMQMVKPS